MGKKNSKQENGQAKKAKPPVKDGFQQIAKSLDVWPGTGAYRVLRHFCEKKNASRINGKVLIQRTQNFSDEQYNIITLLCDKPDFTATTILNLIPPIKAFGVHRLLALRAFVDLKKLKPGSLNRFLIANTPQGNSKTMGKTAWEAEVNSKMMRHDQINVFYNICEKIEDLNPETAIKLLPKVRQLKAQHAVMINQLLKPGATFGKKPINNKTIAGLLELWLMIPEFENKDRIRFFIKRISKKADKKKDFLFILQSIKEELEKEKRGSFGNIVFSIRSYLS